MRRSLSEALGAHGYGALEAGSALEALSIAAHCGQRIDALVSATHLDGIDGAALARKFSHRFPGAAIVLMDGVPELSAVLAEVGRALESVARRGPGSAETAATIRPCRQDAVS